MSNLVNKIQPTNVLRDSGVKEYALDENVVHKTGNEDIEGTKTFYDLRFRDGIEGNWSRLSSINGASAISLTNSNGLSYEFKPFSFYNNNNGNLGTDLIPWTNLYLSGTINDLTLPNVTGTIPLINPSTGGDNGTSSLAARTDHLHSQYLTSVSPHTNKGNEATYGPGNNESFGHLKLSMENLTSAVTASNTSLGTVFGQYARAVTHMGNVSSSSIDLNNFRSEGDFLFYTVVNRINFPAGFDSSGVNIANCTIRLEVRQFGYNNNNVKQHLYARGDASWFNKCWTRQCNNSTWTPWEELGSPDLSNYVTLNTPQTITGTKTFTSNLTTASISASSISASSTISSSSYMTATYFNATSDRRHKEDIKIYDKLSEKLLNLDIYQYKLKNGPEEDMIGIMAQDIQNILGAYSYLLVDDSDKEHLKLRESKLVYFLLDIIKKQDKRIEKLEKSIGE